MPAARKSCQAPFVYRRRRPERTLWETAGEGSADSLAQPTPEFEFDQRIAWWRSAAAVLGGSAQARGPQTAKRKAFCGPLA